MARFTEHGRQLIDQTVDQWRERSLLGSWSLVFDDQPDVWTQENIVELRRRFTDGALRGGEDAGSFVDKWDRQMVDASREVRVLAAEMLLVHFLFASSVTQARKLEIVGRSIPELPLPADAVAVRAMAEKIGNPGVGFNTRRDLQLSYLIDFAERFKALDGSAASALLDDPWALRDFADDVGDGIYVREMRHVLLHLLAPESFERISSGTHKRQIATAFSAILDHVPDDLDEQLLAVRGRLHEWLPDGNAGKGELDFYHQPLRGIWEAAGGDGDGTGDTEALLWKKQLILYGPPGTGKTFVARHLAGQVIRRAALERWGARAFFENQKALDAAVQANTQWHQLHPGFGYEAFIRGLRLEGDTTTYRQGALPDFVDRLKAQQLPDGLSALPGVLVLDEINRTDLSAMLGEAFSLLEQDKRGTAVQLPGFDAGQPPTTLVIPEDLYVIGTMNEIDQSVETLDFALRRRFLWRRCGFDRSILLELIQRSWMEHVPRWEVDDAAAAQLEVFADRATELNELITASPELGEQYEIGHTYFADIAFFIGRWAVGRSRRPNAGRWLWKGGGKTEQPLDDLWARSLRPLLEQYLAGSEVRDSELGALHRAFTAGP